MDCFVQNNSQIALWYLKGPCKLETWFGLEFGRSVSLRLLSLPKDSMRDTQAIKSTSGNVFESFWITVLYKAH